MSWSLMAIPLHVLGEAGTAEWVAQLSSSRGMPEHVPEAAPFASVAEVLGAFRSVGCHGTNWFEVFGEAAGTRLPECPNPAVCASTDGLDLGEVSLQSPGRASSIPPIAASAAVKAVSFRKPNTAAVLRAVCALALVAGPQLVIDDQADAAFVVWPGEQADGLADEWFW